MEILCHCIVNLAALRVWVSKALFTLSARARALYPGTKKTMHRLLGTQGAIVSSFVNFAPAILLTVSLRGLRKKRGKWQNPVQTSMPVPMQEWCRGSSCQGAMPRSLLEHRQKTMFRLVSVPESLARAPCLNGPKVMFTLNGAQSYVHTWCPNTGHKKQTRAHREPVPTSVPEHKVSTLYSGMNAMPELWRGYVIKRCVHISAQRELYSGTKCEHSLRL